MISPFFTRVLMNIRTLPIYLVLLVLSGCLSERSIPMRQHDARVLTASAKAPSPSAREWLRTAQPELQKLHPRGAKCALITEELQNADGSPVDVMQHFDMPPENLQKLLLNYFGLSH